MRVAMCVYLPKFRVPQAAADSFQRTGAEAVAGMEASTMKPAEDE